MKTKKFKIDQLKNRLIADRVKSGKATIGEHAWFGRIQKHIKENTIDPEFSNFLIQEKVTPVMMGGMNKKQLDELKDRWRKYKEDKPKEGRLALLKEIGHEDYAVFSSLCLMFNSPDNYPLNGNAFFVTGLKAEMEPGLDDTEIIVEYNSNTYDVYHDDGNEDEYKSVYLAQNLKPSEVVAFIQDLIDKAENGIIKI